MRKNYPFCKNYDAAEDARRDVHVYGLLQTCRSQCPGMADLLP